MKTNLLIVASLAVALVSCKKNEDSKMVKQTYSAETEVVENNGKIDSATTTKMEKEVNGKKIKSESYPYKGLDGSRAKATFTDNGEEKTITIEANHTKYVLDFKRSTPKGELYERNGISAEASEDSLIISQGNTVIPLEKIK